MKGCVRVKGEDTVTLHTAAARMPSKLSLPDRLAAGVVPRQPQNDEQTYLASAPAPRCLTVAITVPTLETGAADFGTIDLVRMLAAGGHHAIVVSNGGRLESTVGTAGGEFIRLDAASQNPFVIARNGLALARLVQTRDCNVLHALGRTSAWSALIASRMTGVPFVTSWYKGFRDQNLLKHFYNGVMAHSDRVIAACDQIAELITERHHTPSNRIAVIPAMIDVDRFDPAQVEAERVNAMRHSWGARKSTKVILVVGRMLRRKGHHIVIQAVRRLKEVGLKDFLCVFVGEDQGRTRYTGEIWDQVLASDTADVIRLGGRGADMPAAFAAATVVVSAAIQPEGVQRAILEALAMAKPVVVSDLAAGPEIVLSPPAVAEDRMTGLRCASGDAAGLAAALIRLFSMSETARRAIGMRGRDWVLTQFNSSAITAQTLALYSEIANAQDLGRRKFLSL
jgi:glycosyltransferase involved in cell wall biosynthesis